MNRLQTTFHLLAFQIFIFAIYYDVNVIGWKVFDKYESKPYSIPLKGRLMFLTIWDLVSESSITFLKFHNAQNNKLDLHTSIEMPQCFHSASAPQLKKLQHIQARCVLLSFPSLRHKKILIRRRYKN